MSRFLVVLFLGLFAAATPLAAQEESMPKLREAERTLERLEADPETPTFFPQLEKIGASHVGISFEELWDIALNCNPTIRQKGNRISAAAGQRLQAGLYPNPTLTYAGDNLGVHSEVGKHGFGISQEIVTARKKELARKVAGYDVVVARQEYEMECRRLHNDLRIAMAEMLHAQLAVQIERYCERLSDELLRSADRLQRTGKARPVDVLQFRTTLNEAALQLRQAETNQKRAWSALAAVIGRPDLPLQPVRGSLQDHSPPRDWNGIWAQFQQNSPQLSVACLKVRQAQAELARQQAERISNFSATFSLSQDVPANATVPFVSVSVPLKVYDKNQGNIRTAQAELATAHREVDRVTLSLRKQLSDVFCNYENARLLVEEYEKNIIPDNFEALHMLNEIYRRGDMTYLELYTQRHAVMAMLLRYIDALKEQTVSLTLLDGMLLQGTLD